MDAIITSFFADPSKITVIGLLLVVIWAFFYGKIVTATAHADQLKQLNDIMLRMEARHALELEQERADTQEWKAAFQTVATSAEKGLTIAANTPNAGRGA